jgi:hypothetical protein
MGGVVGGSDGAGFGSTWLARRAIIAVMSQGRRNLLLCFFGVVVTLVIAWLFWPHAPTIITEENAERIQAGMTVAQVHEILGGPPRVEYAGMLRFDRERGNIPSEHRSTAAQNFALAHDGKDYWVSEHIAIKVDFGANGLVERKFVIFVDPVPDASWLAWLNRRFRL